MVTIAYYWQDGENVHPNLWSKIYTELSVATVIHLCIASIYHKQKDTRY